MGLSCKFSPKPIHRVAIGCRAGCHRLPGWLHLPDFQDRKEGTKADGRAARSGLAWKVMKLVFDVFALTLIHVISDDGSKKVGKPW